MNDSSTDLQTLDTPVQTASPSPLSFADCLMALVLSRLPHLLRDLSYTAREICGEDFWGALAPDECVTAGITLSRLVEIGAVPLVYVGKNDRNHHVYRRV